MCIFFFTSDLYLSFGLIYIVCAIISCNIVFSFLYRVSLRREILRSNFALVVKGLILFPLTRTCRVGSGQLSKLLGIQQLPQIGIQESEAS